MHAAGLNGVLSPVLASAAGASAAQRAYGEGMLALEHWTSVRNVISVLNNGAMLPGKQAKSRGIGCGSSDVSYFIGTGAIHPDPKRYTTNRTDACMLWECALLDRGDWFWNPGLNHGQQQRNAVLPGDTVGISARAREVATRTGNWCGEICFREPIATKRCFRIFVAGEDLKQEILRSLEDAPPPPSGSWERLIVVRKPSEIELLARDAPRPSENAPRDSLLTASRPRAT